LLGFNQIDTGTFIYTIAGLNCIFGTIPHDDIQIQAGTSECASIYMVKAQQWYKSMCQYLFG
jgi:hypothetical protein